MLVRRVANDAGAGRRPSSRRHCIRGFGNGCASARSSHAIMPNENTSALVELRSSMIQQTLAMNEIKDQLRHLVDDVVEVRVRMGMPGSNRRTQ